MSPVSHPSRFERPASSPATIRSQHAQQHRPGSNGREVECRDHRKPSRPDAAEAFPRDHAGVDQVRQRLALGEFAPYLTPLGRADISAGAEYAVACRREDRDGRL
jgi:hypothetical protein